MFCLLFSFVACSNELDPIEGKYYYQDNEDSNYYVELFLDGTYELYTYWTRWWDENDQKHEKINGKYTVFKGIKKSKYYPYVYLYYPEEVINSEYWDKSDERYCLFIYSAKILSEQVTYPNGEQLPNGPIGNYVKA